MADYRRRLGQRGEELAAGWLSVNGYQILDRNWRCELGELDLVAQEEDCLVLVEVRTRASSTLGTPEDSITPGKRARLVDLAHSYVQSCGWQGDWRIDLVAVEMDAKGHLLRLDHYENAVTG